MKHLVFVGLTALTVAAAAPAAAFNASVHLPNLTYPPKPAPETTQGCSAPATLNGEVCVAPSN